MEPSNEVTACVVNAVVDANGNADALPRLDDNDVPLSNGAGPILKWVASLQAWCWGFPKPGIRSPKLWENIKKSEPRNYRKNADGKWMNLMPVANPNPMGVNRLIVPSCEEKRIKRPWWAWTRV